LRSFAGSDIQRGRLKIESPFDNRWGKVVLGAALWITDQESAAHLPVLQPGHIHISCCLRRTLMKMKSLVYVLVLILAMALLVVPAGARSPGTTRFAGTRWADSTTAPIGIR
jgi:hypothetical protein